MIDNNFSNIAKLISNGIINVQDLSENQKDDLINFCKQRISTNKGKLVCYIKNSLRR